MSVKQKKQLARTQFETAERLREALNGKPSALRTRRDYQRVTDAYRKVYYVAPNSNKADASVVAVAELLAESGRAFDDQKSFKSAIAQYEFLRREYPGSKYRVQALFTIGQIYHQDLDDAAQAKASFQEFLKHYPGSRLADQARAEIQEIDSSAKNAKKQLPAPPKKKPAQPVPEESVEQASASDEDKPASAKTRGGLPLVTGVRHWSTPDYTRVAIDLEQEVKYEAGRVANPDRIFFDLHDTKLSSELIGKTFDVEDGFLKKIRVAPYQRGITRVVLEVDELAEYSAFLLPNPYRLVIDIHGKQPPKAMAKAEAPKSEAKTEAKPAVKEAAKSAPVEAKSEAKKSELPAAKTEARKVELPAPLPAPAPAPSTATGKPKPVEPAPQVQVKEKPKEPAINPEKDAGATDIAKAEPTVKDTAKPTSAPTFEAVAPRSQGKRLKKSEVAKDPNAREAQPTANGERSLIRALGLKIGRIVVDAGHGGHDTGTIGPKGLEEKDLVLDVALRLGKLLENRMGADVVYTRDDDTFVPLETRTAIANKEEADLFISIHANSSRDASARGVETYYLNFTSSADALEVAARENAVSEKSIHELQDLVKKIALKEKIEESREFASDVQKSLATGLSSKNSNMRNRGVKKAPFIVLIGANMPSILAEISFVSNPNDEKKLMTPDWRQKIAESLYRGMAKYVSGLSGVKVAAKLGKDSGQ
ncbi:MAG: N-acetylmuramoyl-L-alanine amidase [Acidobacteriia bacterium]|nr:N-acetylmuramoyl-L-alanine amidase [Terriglobia bacterium]